MHRFDARPLGIYGLAVRLPGAPDLDAYWRLLRAGEAAWGPLPAARFDRQLYHRPGPPTVGASPSDLGGVVPLDHLEAAHLGLDAATFAATDPAHRALLATVLAAVADAGLDTATLAGRELGVWVGHARSSDLASDRLLAAVRPELAAALAATDPLRALDPGLAERALSILANAPGPRLPPEAGLSLQPSAAAHLIASRLHLSGPYQVADAACASSFAALDLAARAIHGCRVEAALVGAASYSQAASLVLFGQAGVLSSTGSFPFDDRADGFVSADGYVALLLAPLDWAPLAGRAPRALVRGLGASCDGRGKSLWAPLREGQELAIARAYRAGLDPSTVEVIEAHATGTEVGDVTELSALATVFASGPRPPPQLVGSVKGNLGHAREASGLASLAKVVLAMEVGELPPTVGLARPSSHLDEARRGLRLAATRQPWPDRATRETQPRRAAVDNFGIGGINYHLVIDGGPAGETRRRRSPPRTPAAGARAAPLAPVGEPIAVVGIGAVLPGAHDAATAAARAEAPTTPGPPPADRCPTRWWNADGAARPLPFVRTLDWQPNPARLQLPPSQLRAMDPLAAVLLEAVTQTFASADWGGSRPPHHSRTAVLVGCQLWGDHQLDLVTRVRAPELGRALAQALGEAGLDAMHGQQVATAALTELAARFALDDDSGSFSASTLASRIAKRFDLMGPCLTLDAEEAAGGAVLVAACDLLASGDCDAVLCAGGQRALHYATLRAQADAGWLDADGLVPAEGGVAVLLRRLTDAEREGQRILAVLGRAAAASAPNNPATALSVAASRLADRSDTTFVAPELHAVATIPGRRARQPDAATPAADCEPLRRQPGSVWGHLGGGTALVALYDALLAVREHSAPRVAAWLDAVGLRGTAYRLEVTLHPPAVRELLARAAAEPTAAPTATRPPDQAPAVVRLGAADRSAFERRLAAAAREPLAALAAETRFGANARHRFAAVTDSAPELAAKLDRLAARAGSANPADWDEAACFTAEHVDPASPAAYALVFPGQGSQHPGMLAGLLAHHRARLEPLVASLDVTLASLGEPPLAASVFAPDQAGRLGSDTWLTQLAVLVGDLIGWELFRDLIDGRPQPRLLLGHSLGEYAALVAAGALDATTALCLVHARCRALDALGAPAGRLVATSAAPTRISRLAAELGTTIVPAVVNGPRQTVLAVQADQVDVVIARLTGEGELARLLPIPHPFHSPWLAAAREPLAAALAAATIRPPVLPVRSGVSQRVLRSPGAVRKALADQLTTPLDFARLVRAARRAGVRLFVELGPGRVATALIRDLLGSRAVAIALEEPRVAVAHRLARIEAALDVHVAAAATASAGGGRGAVRAGDKPAGVLHLDARTPLAEASVPGRRRSTGAGAVSLHPLLADRVAARTGYPRETLDPSLDLEADLGIDSIHKLRLLGELRDRLDGRTATAAPNLSPASLHTLGDLDTALRNLLSSTAAATMPPTGRDTCDDLVPTQRSAPAAAPTSICRFHGSSGAIGRQHGTQLASAIDVAVNRYQRDFEHDLRQPRAHQAFAELDGFFDRAARRELDGLAEGSGIDARWLAVFNLGIEPSLLGAGCTQLAITAAANEGAGLVHAANEDSPAALRFGGLPQRFLQLRRRPRRRGVLVTGAAGQVGGINGHNQAGLTVTSSVLLDQPATGRGHLHPLLVLRLLERAGNLDDALALIAAWPRTGAWAMIVSDAARDELAYVEYDHQRLAVDRPLAATCATNHSRLLAPHGEIPAHSRHRLARATQLLARRPCDPAALARLLADRYDGARGRRVRHPTMSTICRVDTQLSFRRLAAAGRTEIALRRAGRELVAAVDDTELAGRRERDVPARRRKARPDLPTPTTAAAAGRGSIPSFGRFVPRRERLPELAQPLGPRSARTLVIGSGDLAAATVARLGASGSPVMARPAEQAAEALAAGHDGQPWQRLVWLTAGDTPLLDLPTRERATSLETGTRRPFALLQAFVAAADSRQVRPCELLLQGCLGAAGGGDPRAWIDPVAAGLAGLARGLARELPWLTVGLLDTDRGEPVPSLASGIVDAIARLRHPVLGGISPAHELAWARGAAFASRWDELAPAGGSTSRGREALAPGAGWIVTGGAGGVTARCALALATRHPVTVHLLGRRRGGDALGADLEAFSRAGVAHTYHAVDVGDGPALAAVVEELRRSGPLRGILHGAGVEAARSFLAKQPSDLAACLRPKVLGLLHLLHATADDPIAALVAFGSLASRRGGHGQSDYCLANALLAALVGACRTAGQHAATCILWPAWDEVGMAQRPESRLALELAGERFLPVARGTELLLAELSAGLPDPEVIIAPAPAPPAGAPPSRRPPDATESMSRALLCAVGEDRAEAEVDAARDGFLRDHRQDGQPLLPAVISLEALAELVAATRTPPFTLGGFRLHAALRLRDGERARLRARQGPLGLELVADARDGSGRLLEVDRVLASLATVRRGAGRSPLTPASAPAGAFLPFPYRGATDAPPRAVLHGPTLRALTRIAVRGDDAWGELQVNPCQPLAPHRPDGWRLPVTVLDACLIASGALGRQVSLHPTMPLEIHRLAMVAPLVTGTMVRVHVRLRTVQPTAIGCDFVVTGPDDGVLLWARGYRMVVLADDAPTPGPPSLTEGAGR